MTVPPSLSVTDPAQCVILAGGQATRMRPLTDEVPKVLLPVRGRPFTSYQLDWLASQGVYQVVYCIGHLGGMIRTYVGDGSRWGVRVAYVDEGENLKGTAGALRLALDGGMLEPSFLLLYGDSYVLADLSPIREAYRQSGCTALMAVFRNEGRWERSNVVFHDGRVIRYDKWAEDPTSVGMTYVDAGLSILSHPVVERVTPNQWADLADVLAAESLTGELAGYELSQRFYEIGSIEGLQELEAYLAACG